MIWELLNFPFTALCLPFLFHSKCTSLHVTDTKKMSALLRSHQGSHEIDLVLGLRAEKKQFIWVHLLYGWQEGHWIIERTSLKIRVLVYLTGMRDIWGVKSPKYSAITNENRSPIAVSGRVYSGLRRLSRWTFASRDESHGGGSILTRFPFLPVHLCWQHPLIWAMEALEQPPHFIFFWQQSDTGRAQSLAGSSSRMQCAPLATGGADENLSVSSPGMKLLNVHTASSPSLCTSSPITVFAVSWPPTLLSFPSNPPPPLPNCSLFSSCSTYGTKALIWNG